MPYSAVKKGYEISTDHYVVIEDSDLENLPLPTTHTIEISEFVPLHRIQPSLYFKSPYYVAPEKTAQKPYYLLKQALEGTGTAATTKIAFRDREHLCALQPMDRQLIMNTLRWAHEIRPAKELGGDVMIHRRELQMAKSLVQSLTEESFDPTRYRDNFRAALMQVVNAKIEGAKGSRRTEDIHLCGHEPHGSAEGISGGGQEAARRCKGADQECRRGCQEVRLNQPPIISGPNAWSVRPGLRLLEKVKGNSGRPA